MRTRTILLAVVAALFLGSSEPVSAQGVLIAPDHPVPLPRPITPRPNAGSYRIRELAIAANIAEGVARVQVSQTFVNTGSTQMEVQFVFPLPHDGAIDQLTLLVDGKEFPAKLLPAEEARRIYESIVRRNKDPALLEWMGHGMFRTNVFPVPPNAERKVTLQYHQVARKQDNLTELLIPLSTAKYTSQPVENLDIRVSIDSVQEIKSIYSPTQQIDVQRGGPKQAVVTLKQTQVVPASDFRLFFEAADGPLAASLLSVRPKDKEDGYFLLLANPQLDASRDAAIAKTVLMVVDRSGSMAGPKIEQARQSLTFVLQNLREGDLFNIVAYDSAVETFRPELERVTNDTRQAALGFVNGLNAGGGTNIHGALTTSLQQLKDTSRPTYVLFLTDGLPTVGERNEARLAEAVREANTVKARLLSFGVGFDVNSRLLDRLSRDNRGATEYVRPDEDIEAHVGRVYSRMDAPVLTQVQIQVDGSPETIAEGPMINRLLPRQVPDLFAGEQLLVLGRYRKSGQATLKITGQVDNGTREYEFPVQFAETDRNTNRTFVAKLWANRRVGEIIDELDLNGKNEELIKELVQLATEHGIVTPYTSYLADENANRSELALGAQTERARRGLQRLDETSGQSAFEQRAAKGMFLESRQVQSGPAFAGGVPDAPQGIRYLKEQVAFKRGKLVVTPETSQIDLEKDREQIQTIEKFSDAYFKLIAANDAEQNELLSSQADDEELLVKLRGQVYLIR